MIEADLQQACEHCLRGQKLVHMEAIKPVGNVLLYERQNLLLPHLERVAPITVRYSCTQVLCITPFLLAIAKGNHMNFMKLDGVLNICQVAHLNCNYLMH